MAPKPLSQVAPSRKPTYVPDALFVYPDLGKLVMSAIAFGAACDARWIDILVDLLGAKSKVSLAMFQAVISAEGQRGAILAAAEAKLSKTDNLVFKAVYSATQESRSVRNDFAHHLWGLAYGVDNVLISTNPRDAAHHRIRMNAAIRKINQQIRRKTAIMPMEDFISEIDPDPRKAMVWDHGDLLERLNIVRDAYRTINDLSAFLLLKPAKRGPKRQSLLSRPLVAQAHQKLLENNVPKALRRRLGRTGSGKG